MYAFEAVDLLEHLKRAWFVSTEPHPDLKEPQVRSRARVLSTLLLLSATLDALFALVVVPSVYGWSGLARRPDWLLPVVALPVSLGLWWLSRGLRPHIAAIGLSIFSLVATWSYAVAALAHIPDSRELQRILVPILLAQLFSGTFLPFGSNLWVGIGNILGFILIPVLAVQLPLPETLGTALLFAIGVGSTIAVSWLHKHDLGVIRSQQEERARIEEVLEKSRRLESLGRLAGGIAHDFNNMLTSILARIDACRLGSPPLPVARELDGIEAAADRAAALVRRLLEQGRPRQLRMTSLDPNQLARETADLVRPSLPPNIDLVLESEAVPGSVEGDPEQLAQILVNLLTNARDALSDLDSGGTIVLRTGPPREGLVIPPSLLDTTLTSWSISDNGPGLPKRVLEHLFEPFFTTKPPGKGTGLGLWNCLGTIQAHHGEIVAENLASGGARLTVLLPVTLGSSPAASPSDAHRDPEPSRGLDEVPHSAPPRILLVDDEEAIREHGALTLREAGYEVFLAGTGEKALERFESDPGSFALVVLDLSLPGLSGRETFARMRRIAPDQKVLIVTGFDLASGEAEPEIEGASGRLLKPFRMGRLVEECRRLLRTPV